MTFGNNYLCVKTAKWTNCWNSQAGQNKMLLGTYNYNIRVPLQIWRDQTALVKIKFFKWIQNQLFCNLKEEIKVQFIMCELKTYLYMATSLVNNRHSRQKRKKIAPKMFGKFQRTSTFSPLAHLKSNVDFKFLAFLVQWISCIFWKCYKLLEIHYIKSRHLTWVGPQ